LPFAAEEVWSWWQKGSVHRAPWPKPEELVGQDPELLDVASAALMLVRKSKSDLKLSMKAEIDALQLQGPNSIQDFEADLRAAGKIAELRLTTSDEISVTEVQFSEE